MDINIKQIQYNSEEYKQEIALRIEVLRKPLGIYFTKEQLEEEKDEIHFAAFKNNKMIGCILIKDLGNGIAKMRQVAVATEHQKKGVGKKLVDFFEEFVREKGYKSIEMHARKYAVPFYEKLGYEKYGEEFLEVTIHHYKMRKNL
jgi:predicted GNAT family N-acyltransferase